MDRISSHKQNLVVATWIAALAAVSAPAFAQKSDEEVATAGQKPIWALISVPLQYNYDHEIGTQQVGHRNYLNVEPVIPFSIGQDWNLISRTIVPLIDQRDIVAGLGSQSGIGDITQSLFFSPKKPTAGGGSWGAGPGVLMPTGDGGLVRPNERGRSPAGVSPEPGTAVAERRVRILNRARRSD